MIPSRKITLGCLLAIACIGSSAVAQATWTQLSPLVAPGKRCQHEMVEMGTTGIIMFGGEAKDLGQTAINETWHWNGSNWTLLNPTTKPAARGGHAMSYDPVAGRTVLFGGWNGYNYLSDTWEFDGAQWVSTNPANRPSGRDWTEMVFDPISGKTILTGGHDWQNWFGAMTGAFDDMWAWDGVNWTQLTPTIKPPKRTGHAMVFDKNLGKVILFGGYDISGTYGDMWAWDGTNWSQLTPPSLPSARAYHTMTWDAARQVVVLHAGTDYANGVILNDVWEWDSIGWTQTSTTGPALSHTSAVYDSVSQAVLVQGGALINDRSQTDGSTWSYAGPSGGWKNLGHDLPGQLGSPVLWGLGPLSAGSTVTLQLSNASPNTTSFVVIGLMNISLPFYGGVIVPRPDLLLGIPTGPVGAWTLSSIFPTGIPAGVPLYLQAWIVDASGPLGYAATNALTVPTK